MGNKHYWIGFEIPRVCFLFQEDLLIHGDSVYDMIDKQDHQAIQTELVRSAATHGEDKRLFLCRMNVSRNARRQMRFGDQKVSTTVCEVEVLEYRALVFTWFGTYLKGEIIRWVFHKTN